MMVTTKISKICFAVARAINGKPVLVINECYQKFKTPDVVDILRNSIIPISYICSKYPILFVWSSHCWFSPLLNNSYTPLI